MSTLIPIAQNLSGAEAGTSLLLWGFMLNESTLNESTARFSSGITISQAKKNAKRLSKASGIPYAAALDHVATEAEPPSDGWVPAKERVKRRYTLALPYATPIDPRELNVGGGAIVLVRGASGTGKTHFCQLLLSLQRSRVPEQRQYWSDAFSSAGKAAESWGGPQCTLPGLPPATVYIPHAELLTSVFRAGDLLVVDELRHLNADHPSATAALKAAAAQGAIVLLLSQDHDCCELAASCVISCSVSAARGERMYRYVVAGVGAQTQQSPAAYQLSPQAKGRRRIIVEHHGGEVRWHGDHDTCLSAARAEVRRLGLDDQHLESVMADFAAYDGEQLLDMAYSGMEWPIELGLVTMEGARRLAE